MNLAASAETIRDGTEAERKCGRGLEVFNRGQKDGTGIRQGANRLLEQSPSHWAVLRKEVGPRTFVEDYEPCCIVRRPWLLHRIPMDREQHDEVGAASVWTI